MRLRADTDYAIRMILYLASRKGEICPSREIAEAMGIPRDILIQLAMKLRKAKLVRAKSGREGGYALAKDPSKISLHDVLTAMGDELKAPDDTVLAKVSDAKAAQSISMLYGSFQSATKGFAASTTIDGLVAS